MTRAFARWISPACLLLSLTLAARAGEGPAKAPHVVFISGDEEYRSEESLPMLAKILEKSHGFRVSVCYSMDEKGKVDPDALANIVGLEALDDADLVVMFTRFRKLPDDQLGRIKKYAESGRPMMGLRTATHAFKYDGGPHAAEMNEAWERKIFGQRWITHHGHFGDGKEMLTAVTPNPSEAGHPVLRGVTPFETYSWLYHVEGGGDSLEGECTKLLTGKALKSGHAKEFARFPETNPVAWTKTYTGASGKPARVFFTTLGHPFDFKAEPMRKLALNGVFWALGLEEKIPAEGVKAGFVEPYEPNNSGVGGFKKDLAPAYLEAGAKP
ncbi:ThuA domain-containing protein [Paludisphaera mucosa]|uniref:ThuA domain-containing protein n=1 Tax=Paludisphaera mucosa TaxID=3030827 RepID=A0ABT6FID4_9BACT|nr:ThuA domain-containing protein [Paludisphaera mucosa]MDG3007256.1 ThuA domain-containing protein [Paludisphaera mucosa]